MNLTIQLNAVKVWAGAQHTQTESGHPQPLFMRIFYAHSFNYGRVACNYTKPFEEKLQARLSASVEVPDHPKLNIWENLEPKGVKIMSNSLSIGNFSIRQFDDLYSLNDLHKASGGLSKHQPSNFLRIEQTQDLINEIDRSSEMRNALKVKRGGHNQGTYVCKEIAIAYAMWVSAYFMLIVIRTFDSVVSNKPQIECAQIENSLNPKTRRYFIEINITDNLTGGHPINIKATAHDTNSMVTCFAKELGYKVKSLEMIGDAFSEIYTKRFI